jgi:translin
MHRLEQIIDEIQQSFDLRTAARDQALAQSRALTRACALAIRAVHRGETNVMQERLDEAHRMAAQLRTDLTGYPDLYHTGYTQDALKEYAEANITCSLIRNQPLPTPQELDVPPPTYLNGLAESVGEIRRRILDIMRQGYSDEVERLLGHMEDIYASLVTMDYPDAITNGLRRQTDIVRSILERTRGDVTFSLRSEHLTRAIAKLDGQLPGGNSLPDVQLVPPEED